VRRAVLVLALSACGCAHPPIEAPRSGAARFEAYAGAFLRAEPVLLQTLGRTDPRIAARLGDASWREPVDLLVTGPLADREVLDPFQYDLRKLALETVDSELGHLVLPPHVEGPPAILARHRLEEELLARLLAAEWTRLGRERELPRAASALLHAVAEAWPRSVPDDRRWTLDGRIAWRADRIKDTIAPHTLSGLEQGELLSAIDALLPRVSEMPRARKALLRLRVEVAAMVVAPYSLHGWDDLAEELQPQLGAHLSEDVVTTRLARAERALRAWIDVALGVISAEEARLAMRRAGDRLARPGHCRYVVAGSFVRGMGAPPERLALCARVRAIAEAPRDIDDLVALLTLHDDVVLARVAIGLRGERRDPPRELGLASLAPEAPLLRAAATQPAPVVLRGLAAELLVRAGLPRMKERARAWVAFGDAPLDIVERELFSSAQGGARPSPLGTQRYVGEVR
jgi:hypothetical protein